jgi:murein DD-endopeptidase MepM/ murein hydrolase activator NlpD
MRSIAAFVVVLLAVAAGNAAYVVKAGDNLSKIAEANGTTVHAIADANHITNPNLIQIGDSLVIPGDDTYLVRAGDTLAGISATTGVPIDQIKAANGISDPNTIYAGTKLRLDGPSTPVEHVTKPATYTVERGDTLGGIALRFATSVDELTRTNSIQDPNVIRVGTVLTVQEGTWLCPVSNATFFNDWGFPRSGGRFHTGNDLFAPLGSPVYAPVSGTVKQVVGSIGGNQVDVSGNDGTVYIASHLDRFGATGRVSAGDVIGYVGTTGNAAGGRPHVHFEMHPGGGDAVNPYPVLSTACG